jgi:hypothetical protein
MRARLFYNVVAVGAGNGMVVGWPTRVERVGAVNFSGLGRQHRIKVLVALGLLKEATADTWQTVRVELSRVQTEAVRQRPHVLALHADRSTETLLGRSNPSAVSE